MKSCQVHGDLQVQKKKEQHKIKMASQDKTHKSERANVNKARYPTGFICYVFSKVKPVEVHMIFSIQNSAPLRGSTNLARVLHHFKNKGILKTFSYLINTDIKGFLQGPGYRGTRNRTRHLG